MRRSQWASAALGAALLLQCLAGAAQAGRQGLALETAAEGSFTPTEQQNGDSFFPAALSGRGIEPLRSKKQEVEGASMEAGGEIAGPAPDGSLQGEDDGKKETIAEMLGDVLDEEFKKEGEKKKEGFGKQFNETVAASEGTQETVVIISSSKKKSNATAVAAAAAAAEDALEAGREGEPSQEGPQTEEQAAPGSVTHTWVAGGTGSLAGGVALAGGGFGDNPTGGGGSTSSGDGSADAVERVVGEAAAAAEMAAEKAEKAAVKAEKKKELEEKIEDALEADVDRIIDSKDNEYVLSKPSDETSGMNLDPHLVKDLTVLVAASAVAGLVMNSLGQPAINGYFIAGSLVGPGGLKLIKEIVQVQSFAQLGVQLLLFTLGLEFSVTKLRAVRHVALLGGLLQTGLFAALAGLGARLIGTGAAQGAFVGALVAMSSTSIVCKVLGDYRTQNTQQGQITIGTLILQDCLVGLLFAFMPVLATAAGGSGFDLSLLITVMARVVGKLAVLAVGALVVARTVLPPATRWLARKYGADSFQLAAIAFCLLCALASARQGVSAELGAFVAGVMLSATEQQETVLHHLEPLTQFFLALFISSTGMVLSPTFLLHHLPLLAAGATVVIVSKTVLISAVVSAFGYPAATALAVGLNLSQVGEFVFVLLSAANQQLLLADNVYLLLMGITALSLLVTPFLLQLSNRLVYPKGRAYPNGPSGGDLEMAGGRGSPGGSPSKRRPGLGGEQPKESPPPDAPPGGGPGGAGGTARLSAPSTSGELLALRASDAASLEPPTSHGTGVQAGLTKLGHRSTGHRLVQLLAHSVSGAVALDSPGRGGGTGSALADAAPGGAPAALAAR